ncbi:hypothetical protein QOZ80_6AG0531240 [Eleusine coracana subsp. coracana]|nr:hypothetical protein QOZ80_6AG0531240 [Eleusine coracana subsp. coracana]
MEIDSPGHPAPTPVPPSDATAAPPPSPVSPSPRDDVPGGHPARARGSKRARPTTADDGAAPAASPRRKRRGTREPRAEGAEASGVASSMKRSKRGARGVGTEKKGKEVVEEDAAGKVRRRKTTGKAQASKGSLVSLKENGSSLAIVPYATTELTRGANNERQNGCEGLWEMVTDLVMWNNVAKSAFCPISVSCRFGVVMLGLAFFKDSVFQRQQGEPPRQFQLTDEDVQHAARAVLPVINTIISVAQSVFSGDASMTLKVLPLLLFGAKFGHLLTTWRLLATGFFGCFTLPKLYSCYSGRIHSKAKGLKDRILNAWKSCPRKKLVMAIVVTTSWNLLIFKTRILAAFFCMVVLRYYYQYC